MSRGRQDLLTDVPLPSDRDSWRPTAKADALERRACLLARIRSFFSERGVLEVETPLLAPTTATDPHVRSMRAGEGSYLQTSPESYMKRLLAAGSGPIYQVCKAFRAGEAGRHHNPEFTLLEWYRPGFDHQDLMDEVGLLLREVAGAKPAERFTYKEVFEQYVGLDPHSAAVSQLQQAGRERGVPDVVGEVEDRADWLDLLMGHLIQPGLGARGPVFVYDFPFEMAALARLRGRNSTLAERFELFWRGMELANGYHELTDGAEQRRRFEADRARRNHLGLESVPMDERFLAALASGLPEGAGVALGLDRLLMVMTSAESIGDVLSFPFEGPES